jgi:hypothetical protein
MVVCALALPPLRSAQPPTNNSPSPEQVEFFEKHIRPVLAENCFGCHGAKKQRGGLRLDSRELLLHGTDDGPVVVAGHPEKSKLIRAIRHQGEIKMPQDAKLPDQAIADLTAWVKMGIPWPNAPGAAPVASAGEAGKKHWAFQPVRRPEQPRVKAAGRVQSPIDAFILARLEDKGQTPANPADRRTLLRRAYFDLIGLPPSAEEVEAFVKDQAPDAFARVVDRLLASPHYGERWGRYWLDLARYADTKGYVFTDERRFPFAYTYRDYVIQAFNEDLPFDRFIVEQLAADQLTAVDPKADRHSLAAMGFLTLGRRFLNNKHDIIDDRIDVVTRGLLGLTVACARCHDHKYDPIPSKDYYSLYGVFASSEEPKELPQIGEPDQTPEFVAFEKELSNRREAVEKFRKENAVELSKKNRKFRDQLRALQKKVDQFQAASKFAPPRAMVLVDTPQPFQPYVFKRGKAENHGPTVPRQFLEVLSGPDRKPFTHGSGRLELAQAIAARDNPLTARVMVNRIWMYHFGAPLVPTPSDFGIRSEPPSHPELLNYLAWYFMEHGWSVKKMHRLIMLSSTYQQASVHSSEQQSTIGGPRAVDPENRLLWKMNRRRLDFEGLRDALLCVSGNLDLKVGGRPVDITSTPYTVRRTVYAFIDRQNLPSMFRTFDFASPDSSSPRRFLTTVPQQALFLMNNGFVVEQVKDLLRLPELSGTMTAEAKIQKLYRRIFGRNPDADEIALGVAFINQPGTGGQLKLWERYTQVLLLTNEFSFVD